MTIRRAVASIVVLATAACHRGPAGRAAVARPNLLLITIDTFRADRLSPSVTPNLDRLASGGVRFTSARSAVPLTLPSHTTMLTGLLPPAHGVRENGLDRLSPDHDTLATLLKTAGYRTGAFVGAFVLDRRFGLARGFDMYDDRIARDPSAPDRLEAERPASAVIDAALAWLRSQQPPFFAWIHLYDPHAPYAPPAEYAARAKSPYDGELMYVDAQLARIWSWLDSSHLADTTVVLVAGDHGEGLMEHGERTHGMLLYDSTLRVPLFVLEPHRGPTARTDPVTLADVAPTLLRAAGLTPPSTMRGRDLLDTRATRTLFSETEYPRVAGWSPLLALTDGRWKLIRGDTSTELYDVETDPAELHEVAAQQPATAGAMGNQVEAMRAGAVRPARGEVSPETAERLRSLGYVAASPQRTPAGHAPSPARHIGAWDAFEEALATVTDHPGDADALPALKAIAAGNPDSFVFTATLARATKAAGNLAGALAIYRDAARRWPGEPTLFHDLAVTAGDAASHTSASRAAALRDEARRAEEAALALQPDYAAAYNGLGLLAAEAGRDADAVRHFSRAADLDPTNASYWTNLGNARRATNDAAGAETAYTHAIGLDGRASDAANGIGALLVAKGRPADAAVWFERALAADPSSVDARLNLGIALQQSGNPVRAAAEYRAVLAAPQRYGPQRDAARKLLAALGAQR